MSSALAGGFLTASATWLRPRVGQGKKAGLLRPGREGAWSGPRVGECDVMRGPEQDFPQPQAAPAPGYLHHHVAPAVGRAVVDHGDDGHAQVAADAKANAEAQTAHDGDNVAAREAKAGAIHDRRVPGLRRDRAPICTQLQSLGTFLPLLQKTAARQQGSDSDVRAPSPLLPMTRIGAKLLAFQDQGF